MLVKTNLAHGHHEAIFNCRVNGISDIDIQKETNLKLQLLTPQLGDLGGNG